MHNHSHHGHSHSHHHHSVRNIQIAFFLNLVFAVIEVIGGLFSNSTAILSDAVHDLGDSFTLGVAWYLQKLSEKKRDVSYTYGYARFSVFGAFITSLVLITGSVFILSEAIPRLLDPEPIHSGAMLGLAVLGIAVNGMAAFRLRKGESLNEKVVSWHLMEDILGWVAVLMVSIVLFFKDIYILDPILSIVITCYVLYNVFRHLRSASRVFLQKVPEQVNYRFIEEQITGLDLVRSVHHFHIWTLDGKRHVMTVHVVVDNRADGVRKRELKAHIGKIASGYGIEHVTIDFETEEEGCLIGNKLD